jgi:hypothetical protein
MTSSRSRPSVPLTLAGGLVLLSFLACKCGDRSGGGDVSATAEGKAAEGSTAATDEDLFVDIHG